MALSRWLSAAAALVFGVLAVAWWTSWLDPYLPALAGWRQQARQTAAGQALSPAPAPRWVTIAPGDKTTCLKRAGGELNDAFVQCRNGRRELVRVNHDGTRTVLQVKPLD